MKIYSIKKYRNKGRNIKKYKKSRRGCRKRSLIGGKTRRYKVFKNTKRRTLGKRKGRRMVGGTAEALQPKPWTFLVDAEKLKKYVNSKYKQNFSRLELVAFGYVGITNRSKGYFTRADHRLEQIAVVACRNQNGEVFCYAIARCTKTCDPKGYTLKDKECPNFNMEEKILFFTPEDLRITYLSKNNLPVTSEDNLGVTSEDNLPVTSEDNLGVTSEDNLGVTSEDNLGVTIDKKTENAVQLLRKKLEETYTEKRVNEIMSEIMMFEFENMISSSDLYRIVIFPYLHSKTLKPFFSSVKRQNFTPTNVDYPTQQPEQEQLSPSSSKRNDNSALDGVGFFAMFLLILNELKV
jgi:hypothetical protein